MTRSIGFGNRLSAQAERNATQNAVKAFEQRRTVQGTVGLKTLGKRFAVTNDEFVTEKQNAS